MPTYDYFCPKNERCLEVIHGYGDEPRTWGDLCRLIDCALGDTPAESPVRKLLSAPNLAFPRTNADLKNMGFTKLVRREKGVYENVTATGTESRFVKDGDSASMPHFHKKIGD